MDQQENKNIGIYIHVPFCAAKCPYCDFYSMPCKDDSLLDNYTAAVIADLKHHCRDNSQKADTLYFGGGTPPLLGGERIAAIIDTAAGCYGLHNAEITVEVNPAVHTAQLLCDFARAGVNRLSIGMQSVNDKVLKQLGRLHKHDQTKATCANAANAGISNISLDIMLACPGEKEGDISSAVSQAKAFGARHLSAYILKVEKSTPFFNMREKLQLPDEDQAADIYLNAICAMQQHGYAQYEISNFCIPGFQSRHNTKYWNADPVLALGPSAYSFLNGERLYYPKDLHYYTDRQPMLKEPESYPAAGSPGEYIMLRLRLTRGVTQDDFRKRFKTSIPDEICQKAARFPKNLVQTDDRGIRLTSQGFLLSNSIISSLI